MIDETLFLEIVDNQHWIFPLPYPLILDSKLVQPDKIQLYLRITQYINQNGLCLCNENLVGDEELHHALISRKDAMKISLPNYIHCSYNVLLLHRKCHKEATREKCYVRLLTIFPQKDIEDWYYQAPFKSAFRKLPHVT